MINRIKGVLFLEAETFNEVEHDKGANGQAALVVIVASILVAIDAVINIITRGHSPWFVEMASPLVAFLMILIWSLVAWPVWAAATYFVGAKIFSGEATYGEMLRVTGFAYAPLGFMILGVIPCIGFAISLVVSVWALAAVFVGVREGLDLGFGKALVTVIIGWFVYLIGMGILGIILGAIQSV